MSLPQDNATSAWHLDKRIPLALIFTLVAQIFAFGWAASAFNSRLGTVEETIHEWSALRSQRDTQFLVIADTLGRLQNSTENTKDQIKEIKASLDQIAVALGERHSPAH